MTSWAWTSWTAACSAPSSKCTTADRVGLDTLAAVLGEESVTLYDVCEPYLMQMGMLTRTPRGRCVTRLAYEHLHMAVPKRFDEEDSGQTSMF